LARESAKVFSDDAWVIEILFVSSLWISLLPPRPTSARSPASARPCQPLRGAKPWRESSVPNFCFWRSAACSSSGWCTCS